MATTGAVGYTRTIGTKGYHFTMAYLFVIMNGLLIATTLAQTKYDGIKSYCSSEAFDISCGENEVILMQSATYGRMSPGRCISGEYSHSVGCYADMLAYMDTRCSGRRSCKVVIGTLEQVAQPCQKDFKSYLEAEYLCVKVATTHVGECSASHPVALSGPSGYIGQDTLLQSGRYLNNCVWRINAPPGQTIGITLYTFNRPTAETTPETTYKPCSWNAIVKEKRRSTELDLCNGDEREVRLQRHDVTSLDLSFYGMEDQDSIPHFLLEYRIMGCSNIDPPHNAWSHREGDNLMVKCNLTGETWYLTCRDNEWIGIIGNCSKHRAHKVGVTIIERIKSDGSVLKQGIVFAVFIGLVLGLVIGVAMLSFVFCCRRRVSQHVNRDLPDLPALDIITSGHMEGYPDHLEGYPGLLTQEKSLGDNVCEYTHVWEVRPQHLYGTSESFKDEVTDNDNNLKTISRSSRVYTGNMDTFRGSSGDLLQTGSDSTVVCLDDTQQTRLKS